jgi:hypothetical protein
MCKVVSGEGLSVSAINEIQEPEGTQNYQRMYFVNKISVPHLKALFRLRLRTVRTYEPVPPT